jgi:hypothetical protein
VQQRGGVDHVGAITESLSQLAQKKLEMSQSFGRLIE